MPQSETSPTPALPSVRPTKRPLRERMQWPLTGLGLALLVLLVLPSAQIRLGASQLHGLIGSYTSNGHTWQVSYSSQGNTTWTARGSSGGSIPWDSTASSFTTPPDTFGLDAKCIGQISATLTWIPATGQTSATDPPASQVLVTETGYAYFNGGGVRTDHGTLLDGWPADTPPDSPNNIYGPHYYYSTSGTHYEVKDGSSGTITVGPFSLNASTPMVTDPNVGNDVVAATVSLTVSGATAPASVTGDSTVDTAGWDSTHPRFFSGTNCKATGTGSALSGYVQQATLSINGTAVKQYTDAGSRLTSINLSVTFDSTHFPDTTPISIRMSVTGSGGNSYSSAPVQANAYNQAYVLGNNTLAYGSTSEQYISTRASSMNTTPFGTTSDVKQTILGSIPIYTAFYVDTHGYPGLFGDCYALPNSSDQYYLYADSHQDSTGSQSVTMAVKSKTVNEPPYNFVDLDDCYTAGNSDPTDRQAPYGIDSTLATAFGVNGPDDCAILGWTTETDDSARNANFVSQVWQNLSNGQTLATALSNAKNLYPPQLNAVDNAAKPLTFGDASTTLHSTVYGGTSGNWFR